MVCKPLARVFHHHIVEIMQQLIAAIKEKGPGADIDMSDVGQRESFDTIGGRRLPSDFMACAEPYIDQRMASCVCVGVVLDSAPNSLRRLGILRV